MKFIKLLFLILILPLLGFSQSKVGYINAGDIAMTKHDPYSAIDYYNSALKYGLDPSLSYKLGNAYRDIGNYQKALSCFKYATELSKNDPILNKSARIANADMLRRLGFIEKSIVLTKTDTSLLEFLNDLNDAFQYSQDSLPLDAQQLSQEINTGYSDFAPQLLGDSIFYFSSMNFFINKKKEKIQTAKILFSNFKNNRFESPKTLPEMINLPQWNNANMSISPDGKIVLFTRCSYNENNELRCNLYEATFKDGKFQQPIKLSNEINQPSTTSTQPCITGNYEKGYLLFFVSDRKGGNGGLDIWKSERNPTGKYTKPENVGKKINTASNEITPFFDRQGDTIYFSSDRNTGLGAYDIFKSYYGNDTSKIKVDHLQYPYNSGYNDLYFNKSYGNLSRTFIVSNRPPSRKIMDDACCFDIFEIIPSEEKMLALAAKKLQIPIEISNNSIDSTLEKKETFAAQSQLVTNINSYFPLRLYFDNDYPDPKSRSKTTNTQYDRITDNYLNRLNKYLQFQTENIEKENITKFFNDSIKGNFLKLDAISNYILQILKADSSSVLKLMIQGSASPLANSDYNVILSSRRIQCLLNFWQEWNEGILERFIKTGRLQIREEAIGETQSEGKVSDLAIDKVKSIYSVAAAIERRIEITEITMTNP